MAESLVLTAEKREGRGTHKARHLRKQGKIPGVVYGHKEATESVSLSEEDLSRIIRQGVRVLDLQLSSGLQTVLIRELQWDHLGKEILHIDFARVSKDERIEVPVRVEIRGTAPGVTAGGLMDQQLHTLRIECLAISVPETIRVNVNELQIDQAIHAKDLVFPEGVKCLDDPEAVIVQVVARAEEPEDASEAEKAEPEVIGRTKEEEQEEK